MKTTIRLSGPADVLTVLPYQLGFHPQDCLVVVSLHGSRMGLVQRIDLPSPEHAGDAVAALMAPLRQDRPKSVLLVGYEDREGESRVMLDEMRLACQADGVHVDDRMVVRGGRWFDPDCTGGCCPSGGLALPAPSEVPAVAEFVGREICPLPDRSALADLVEPTQQLRSGAVSRFADEALVRRWEKTDGAGRVHGAREGGRDSPSAGLHKVRARELALWSRVLCGEDGAEAIGAMSSQDLATLAVSLTDVDLRDALIAWLCPGTLPPELIDPRLFVQMSRALPEPLSAGGDSGDTGQVIGGQRRERRLCELCAALPDAWAVPILTVLASYTWWRGDGALTRVALDRALRIDPHYRLAQLLVRMVDLAIRPERASA